MSKESQQLAVEVWRARTKAKIVACFGGKCNRCSYNVCNDALDLHHLDPSTKHFSIAESLRSPKAWQEIVAELEKCVLLCNRCHKELHCGIWNINEIECVSFQDKPELELTTGQCLICGKDVCFGRKTCSRSCASRLAGKVVWPDNAELDTLLGQYPHAEVARRLNVSLSGLRKHLRRRRPKNITG